MENKYISIFYNFQTLQDTLVVKISGNKIPSKTIFKNNLLFFYDNENNILGFNIHKVSEKKLKLNYGLNEPTPYLIQELEKITNLELSHFVNKIPFVVGVIKDVEKISNSHLNYCTVDIGEEQLKKIICGANNVKPNIKVVVALPGCIMPNGQEIFKSKLMNFESEGMICSAKELNLFDSKNIPKSILELPNETKEFSQFKEVYNCKNNML
ncbi:YtpR family tRNA-binding protein [Mycoplasmoides alvi]|uniref:YtpR family tRNA-binding protein n=1 Tax=Mycoplasmoides alvi TaxID=78580 RepID=UPI0006973BDD|nr:hypothetical protein [Mycoplasmoides alvi]